MASDAVCEGVASNARAAPRALLDRRLELVVYEGIGEACGLDVSYDIRNKYLRGQMVGNSIRGVDVAEGAWDTRRVTSRRRYRLSMSWASSHARAATTR